MSDSSSNWRSDSTSGNSGIAGIWLRSLTRRLAGEAQKVIEVERGGACNRIDSGAFEHHLRNPWNDAEAAREGVAQRLARLGEGSADRAQDLLLVGGVE